jgi:hypothetical protein
MNRKFIQIEDGELNKLYNLATRRNEKERIYGSRTYGNKDNSLWIHYAGLIGEFGCAKWLGVKVDETIFATHGDRGVDFTYNGLAIDVKTSLNYDNPYLKVQSDKDYSRVNVFLLATVHPEDFNVEVVGYAPKDLVTQKIPRQVFRNEPRLFWTLEADELLPYTDLKDC